ncbi:S41 family peptidase [Parapedobacter sp. 10938]|uniref:S41 family peptidase n=1 Tax=Parapedobacter flavus TaxID=3110225 RepID=UPI002DBCBFA6|nr:S41 family peptidase [Parapedobacter sp. 10938]MEC3881422.1 S41 family peptidase [Parapedobacter sp. 10938]
MNISQLIRLAIVLLALGTNAACNRQTVVPELERPARPDSQEDLLKDSVYFFTHGFYLWQADLPDWFGDIRNHTQQYNSADAVLEALKGYALDDEGNPYDRFSFLDRWGTVDAEIQQGYAGSFGFDVRYNNDTDLYVKKVDAGSPADQLGIRRGWQILQVNGTSDLSLSSMEQDNFTFLFDALDASAISLVLRKPDGEEVDMTLKRGNYQLQPIMSRRIYNAGSKKVGYFMFDIFVSTLDNRGNPTYVKGQLDELMDQFEAEGVEELIVDLRYNGGGAVVTAEYLSNLLVPAGVGHGLMYTNKVNSGLDDFLRSYGVQLDFSDVHFNKVKNLHLNRIYFLVTEGTASASELLINNLKPHIDVKLIGEHTTYGKPVGFFNWNILGVDLYAVSFQTFNSAGHGDYFSGMPVDKVVIDDLTKDFGDAQEDMIAEALYYAENGSFSSNVQNRQANTRTRLSGSRSEQLNRRLDRHGRKGMFTFRKRVTP